jgi:UPF0225 protein NEIFL0001_0063
MTATLCPCQSGRVYTECCAPFHAREAAAATAEELMRSRYSAYVLQEIDYIVDTTVPEQQNLLDKQDLAVWSKQTQWSGLKVIRHVPFGKLHALVEFEAYFKENGQTECHHELSAFVKIDGRWYFIDPTVALPTMKQPCLCGSGKKFKACCGQFFK